MPAASAPPVASPVAPGARAALDELAFVLDAARSRSRALCALYEAVLGALEAALADVRGALSGAGFEVVGGGSGLEPLPDWTAGLVPPSEHAPAAAGSAGRPAWLLAGAPTVPVVVRIGLAGPPSCCRATPRARVALGSVEVFDAGRRCLSLDLSGEVDGACAAVVFLVHDGVSVRELHVSPLERRALWAAVARAVRAAAAAVARSLAPALSHGDGPPPAESALAPCTLAGAAAFSGEASRRAACALRELPPPGASGRLDDVGLELEAREAVGLRASGAEVLEAARALLEARAERARAADEALRWRLGLGAVPPALAPPAAVAARAEPDPGPAPSSVALRAPVLDADSVPRAAFAPAPLPGEPSRDGAELERAPSLADAPSPPDRDAVPAPSAPVHAAVAEPDPGPVVPSAQLAALLVDLDAEPPPAGVPREGEDPVASARRALARARQGLEAALAGTFVDEELLARARASAEAWLLDPHDDFCDDDLVDLEAQYADEYAGYEHEAEPDPGLWPVALAGEDPEVVAAEVDANFEAFRAARRPDGTSVLPDGTVVDPLQAVVNEHALRLHHEAVREAEAALAALEAAVAPPAAPELAPAPAPAPAPEGASSLLDVPSLSDPVPALARARPDSDDPLFRRLRDALAESLGPFASVEVWAAFERGLGPCEMVSVLAETISDPDRRAAFRAELSDLCGPDELSGAPPGSDPVFEVVSPGSSSPSSSREADLLDFCLDVADVPLCAEPSPLAPLDAADAAELRSLVEAEWAVERRWTRSFERAQALGLAARAQAARDVLAQAPVGRDRAPVLARALRALRADLVEAGAELEAGRLLLAWWEACILGRVEPPFGVSAPLEPLSAEAARLVVLHGASLAPFGTRCLALVAGGEAEAFAAELGAAFDAGEVSGLAQRFDALVDGEARVFALDARLRDVLAAPPCAFFARIELSDTWSDRFRDALRRLCDAVDAARGRLREDASAAGARIALGPFAPGGRLHYDRGAYALVEAQALAAGRAEAVVGHEAALARPAEPDIEAEAARLGALAEPARAGGLRWRSPVGAECVELAPALLERTWRAVAAGARLVVRAVPAARGYKRRHRAQRAAIGLAVDAAAALGEPLDASLWAGLADSPGRGLHHALVALAGVDAALRAGVDLGEPDGAVLERAVWGAACADPEWVPAVDRHAFAADHRRLFACVFDEALPETARPRAEALARLALERLPDAALAGLRGRLGAAAVSGVLGFGYVAGVCAAPGDAPELAAALVSRAPGAASFAIRAILAPGPVPAACASAAGVALADALAAAPDPGDPSRARALLGAVEVVLDQLSCSSAAACVEGCLDRVLALRARASALRAAS